MNKNGRRTDVIVEERTYRDDMGMVKFLEMVVYADPGNAEIIKSVPGVVNVYNSLSKIEYVLSLDPRYDRAWIAAEIEAQIKIHAK